MSIYTYFNLPSSKFKTDSSKSSSMTLSIFNGLPFFKETHNGDYSHQCGLEVHKCSFKKKKKSVPSNICVGTRSCILIFGGVFLGCVLFSVKQSLLPKSQCICWVGFLNVCEVKNQVQNPPCAHCQLELITFN